MAETLQNVGWAVLFSVVGGLAGVVLVQLAAKDNLDQDSSKGQLDWYYRQTRAN